MAQLGKKLVGFAVLLFVILGGTYLARDVAPPGGAAHVPITVTIVDAPVAVAPGTSATYAIALRTTADVPQEASVSVKPSAGIDATVSPAAVTIARGAGASAFVTVRVGDVPPRPTHLVFEVAGGEGRVGRVLSLSISEGGPRAAQGDFVAAKLTGRLPDGSVFWSTVPGIQDSEAFPRARYFEPLPRQAIEFDLAPHPVLPEGLWRGIIGMGENESRTIVVPPAEAFGDGAQTLERPRFDNISRVREVSLSSIGTGTLVGDRVSLGEGFAFLGARWVVTETTETRAKLRLDVAPGDAFTLFPELANFTIVESVGETSVRLEHAPPDGHEFAVSPNACAASGAVEGRTETSLLLRLPLHPLCGETVIFDVTVVRVVASRS